MSSIFVITIRYVPLFVVLLILAKIQFRCVPVAMLQLGHSLECIIGMYCLAGRGSVAVVAYVTTAAPVVRLRCCKLFLAGRAEGVSSFSLLRPPLYVFVRPRIIGRLNLI
jgi:hypothetical protein